MNKFRFQPWQLALAVTLVCGGIVGVVAWRRATRPIDATQLIEYLPPDRSTHVYIDFQALRQAGLLDLIAGSKSAEEPEYQKFVEQTGFDYRTDLDAVAAAFSEGNNYFVVRGRYSWKQLASYAQSQGGRCRNTVCSMPASRPARFISYYPVKSNILAIAVSTDERGVTMIGPQQWKRPPHLPNQPVWISVPSFVLNDTANLPEGTHAFLEPLSQAEETTFSVGPSADSQHLEIHLDALCASPEIAAQTTSRLTAATDLLKKMLEREHLTPGRNDLAAVLIAGTFSQQKDRVTGSWPVERGFIEALTGGKVQ